MNPAKAGSRYVDFSGVPQSRKGTSEKSTHSDPRPGRRLNEKTKTPRRAAGIRDAQMPRYRPLNTMRARRRLRNCLEVWLRFATIPACSFLQPGPSETSEIDCKMQSNFSWAYGLSQCVNESKSLMDPFSYLSVLISIILALGITRLLGGVGEMLQARSRRRIYWVHTLWIANLFLFLVMAWWIFYRWRVQQQWTFFLLVFVLISPTILYLASLLLFPREGSADERAITKPISTPIIVPSLRFLAFFGRSTSSTRCSKAFPTF